MKDKERLRAEFDDEFLKELEAADAERQRIENAASRSKARSGEAAQGAAASWAADGQSAEEAADAEREWNELAPFTRAVVETIRSIPSGRVMSYGQVAAVSGSPRGARQVVRILHTLSRKYDLPWHRVVNIRGEIALDEHGGGEQQERLEAEGVEFGLEGKIDLSRYRHEGGE